MKKLIDRKINKIFISEKNQKYLRFETDKGNLDYLATGECCSESYFSDVNRTKYLFGRLVWEVVEISLMLEEVNEIEPRQGIDKIYGFRIETDKGIGLVIMRNSSNGYYGGEVIEIDKIPEDEKMFEITKDFCAKDLFSQKTYEN